LNGTDDDNFIVSAAGNDIIEAKKGNDAIINHEGDTTYKFNLGDGHDIIMDYQGTDKILFGPSINQEDVAYCRNDKDLVISIKNMSDSITILNWFLSDDYKIESIEFSNGVIITPDDVHNLLSTTIATGYDDVIIGNDEDNTIDGLSGNDYIEGRGGNDTIIGGLGKDIMKGGAGDDIYYIDNAGDQVIENENEGNDTIRSNVSYILPDNVENLELIGSGEINGKGNELNNTIAGNGNDNILDGSSGVNTLKGGKGDDTYIINETNANDVIVENKDEGNDTVKSSISYTLNAENVENLVLTGETNVNGTGNSMDNYIEGNKGNNILNGGAGNDKLYGNGGSDTLIGGTGDDTYIIDTTDATIIENANEGIDTVITNINYALGANIENLVLAGKESITGTGNAANNIITGNDSNNTFIGGKGNDTLAGGAGADTYIFNLGDGQDIIQENSPNSNAIDKIIFGVGITKSNTKFTKIGYDLIVTINGTSDKITIKNSNLAFGSRIERFEFSDGSFIDGTDLYKLFAEPSKPNLYSDVSYLDVSSKSSSIDREYYEEGELKSETIYNDQGNIVSKTVYSSKGYVIEEYTYNSGGQILKEVIYEDNYATTRQIKTQKEYIYSNGRLSEVKNYNVKALNSTEKYTYGSNGLVNRITIYQKNTSTVKNTIDFTYDSAKRLSTKTIYKKNTTDIDEKITYTYDSAGRITRELTQEGYYRQIKSGTTTKSVWDIHDAKIVTYTYNAAGNITKKVTQAGHDDKTVSGATTTWNWNIHNDEIIDYTYNAAGQLIKEYARSSYSEQVKSGSSTRTEWKMRDSKVVNYTYNNSGLITKKVTQVGYNKVIPNTLPTAKYQWVLRNDEIIEYEYTSDGKPLRQTTTKAYPESVQYLSYSYSDYRNMRKTNEIIYTYNNLGDIQSVTEMMGYNETVFWGGVKQEWTQVIKNKIEYTYNNNYQLSQILKYEQYSETKYTKYNGIEYSYPVYRSRESEKTIYTYNADCRVINEKIYKYKTINNKWTPYLNEEIKYTYDSEGRLYLAEHFKDGKPSEAFKYEYAFDDNAYLIKQNIYQGVISNNTIASYKKIQEVTVNSYFNNLNGDSSNNTLNGSNQSDNLLGGAGNDVLYGNGGNDYLDGGTGADLMVGGKGDDIYVIDSTKDIIVEHANQGIDTVQTHLDYTLGVNLENLVLTGTGNATGKGNNVDNIIQGNSGNNILYGYAGNDIIDGGAGNDTIYGGDHNDIISGGAGNDTLYGESGDDTYYFKANDGLDNISDSSGKKDRVLFDADVDKNKIAFYQDGNNLIIDYGNNSGSDIITIANQANTDNAIEKFELSDGTYITNYDVNQIIQNMTAYAQNNAIEFDGIESVKNNSDLMNLIATSWHN